MPPDERRVVSIDRFLAADEGYERLLGNQRDMQRYVRMWRGRFFRLLWMMAAMTLAAIVLAIRLYLRS